MYVNVGLRGLVDRLSPSDILTRALSVCERVSLLQLTCFEKFVVLVRAGKLT